ncbi:hypothetical protein EDE15_3271 [Edaphobacter aggregans]|uniref:Uncharacterized protein n=1 Tax=Edaphobacter aggregans TaxID=570835 RepID=A0A428MLD3_9BACT|nr:hypothetical protein EDE15_3271 [Edaphobacter aggregans]
MRGFFATLRMTGKNNGNCNCNGKSRSLRDDNQKNNCNDNCNNCRSFDSLWIQVVGVGLVGDYLAGVGCGGGFGDVAVV